MAGNEFAEQIVQENNFTRSERSIWDNLWQDLADYEMPTMADFTQRNSPGERRSSKIVNSAGVLAARESATRVNGFLTGDGTNWFDLRIPGSRLENDPAVRGWLDQLKAAMYAIFSAPGSGFGVAKDPTYRQLIVFGNGPLFIGESNFGLPIYHPEFLGNCSIWTDDNGKVIALFREYRTTALGLARQFGEDALPQEVKAALATEPQKRFTCIHGVRPRTDNDPLLPAGQPWIEGYVLKDNNHLLAEPSGYWEFPWLFPRWAVTPNEVYGRGPGEDALQDVKMVQAVTTSITKHIAMNTDPQWMVEDESGVSPRINQVPGGYVYARQNQGNWNVQRLGPSGSAQEGLEFRDGIVRDIKSLFYLDAFKMVEKISEGGSVVHMSATEFAGRQADQFRFAGPALERLRSEMLFPTIGRTASILIRNKKVPPPPPQLRGAPIHAEYVSPLAVAQRASEGSAVLQFINDLIPLAQIDQRALDIVNVPEAGRVLGRARHVPQLILNTADQIAAIQQGRAEAAAEAQATEQMVAAAGASKDSAQALKLLTGGAA